MVMEASPSPQSVGREFVRQYYTLLNKAPAHLHRFYNNSSSFVHGGLDAPNRETPPVVGQKQIHNRIQQLNFRDCHAKISQVDSQATLGNGVVVQVTGELSNGGAPMRRFTQTFVLAAQSPKKYYVHNDIFRYQDLVFSEEDCEAEGGRSDMEDDLYLSPAVPAPAPAPLSSASAAASGAPAPFPAAPPAPLHPLAPPPLARAFDLTCLTQHLNGHEDTSRASLGSSSSAGGRGEDACVPPVVSQELEPEEVTAPVPQLPPPPPPAQSPVLPPPPPEPKTYANLLKSGGSHSSQSTPAPTLVVNTMRVSGESLPQRAPRAPPRPPRTDPASSATPQPDGGVSGRRYSDSQQLFLGKVPLSATEEELRVLFSQYGSVAELRVHAKPGGRNQSYAFVTYDDSQAAQDCLNSGVVYTSPDGSETYKLNVEEKKPPRGRGGPPPPRASFPPRAPPAFRR